MCASFRVGIYLFDLWAKRLIFWKFCLAPTSYCEKEDDDDKNLSFFLLCLCFLPLSSKKRACATFVEKDTFLRGRKPQINTHTHVRVFQNRHDALSALLSVLLLALFLEDIRCFFNLLAR